MGDKVTIIEFLEARIAEDDAAARAAIADDGGSDEGFAGQYEKLTQPPSGVGYAQGGFGEAAARLIATYAVPSRVLAECAAKRILVEDWKRVTAEHYRAYWVDPPLAPVVAAFASVYKDHPDYRKDWAL